VGTGDRKMEVPVSALSSLPGGKAAEREADHSRISNNEVKNGEAIPPLPRTSS
jgi:hypothetical protein